MHEWVVLGVDSGWQRVVVAPGSWKSAGLTSHGLPDTLLDDVIKQNDGDNGNGS